MTVPPLGWVNYSDGGWAVARQSATEERGVEEAHSLGLVRGAFLSHDHHGVTRGYHDLSVKWVWWMKGGSEGVSECGYSGFWQGQVLQGITRVVDTGRVCQSDGMTCLIWCWVILHNLPWVVVTGSFHSFACLLKISMRFLPILCGPKILTDTRFASAWAALRSESTTRPVTREARMVFGLEKKSTCDSKNRFWRATSRTRCRAFHNPNPPWKSLVPDVP